MQQYPEQKDNRKVIYGILIGALVLTWAYIFYDKSKNEEEKQQLTAQVNQVDSARLEILEEFNLATIKIDSLTNNSIELQGSLADKNAAIQQLKSEIRSILSKKNATSAELEQAKALIAELNGKVNDLFAELQQVKAENKALTASNEQLNQEKTTLTSQKAELEDNLNTTKSEKKKLEDKVDIASTLKATNINIAAINIKNSGQEVSTTSAKRADMFLVSFIVDENRVTPSGSKDLYVCITGPDGKLYTEGGSFSTREEGQKSYTNQVTINYETGKQMPVSFNWKKNDKYQAGDYKIEIYNNGFKIGEGTRTLKKGGIF